MGDLVYINDIAMDLKPNTLVSVNIQRIDFGDFSKNFVSYSNTIKLTKSQNNNLALGFSNDEKSLSATPYSLLPCKIVQNGIEVLNGTCILKEVSEEYEISVFDSFFSILSYIEGKNISDLDIWGTEAWNAAGIDAARLKTTGLVNGFANFGRTLTYEVNYYLPFFYYSTLVTEILKSTGLNPQGSILTNTDFTELVFMPFNTFTYPDAGLNQIKRTATSSSQSLTLSINQAFLSIVFDQSNYGTTPFNDTFVSDITVNIRYNSLNFTIDPFSTSTGDIRIVGSIQGTVATSSPITLNTTNSDQVYTFNGVELRQSETIEVRFYFNKDADYPTDFVSVDVGNSGNGTSYTIVENTTVARAKPYWKKLVNKDIVLKDVLKDFFIRFGIIYKVEGSNIILKTIEDVINDYSSAIDWTSKRAVNEDKDKIVFQTQYSQSNYFKYSDNVSEPTLGQGVLSVVNSALSAAKEIFTSVFKNANSWSTVKSVTLPVYDSTSTGIADIKNEPPFILATLRNRIDEASITFDAIARTDYKIAYFVDSTKAKDTSFNYFVGKYYKSFSAALQKNKLCTYRYYLNENDIANYDPHKLIFDNGSYYIVNKIKNFMSGKVTEVELFKVN